MKKLHRLEVLLLCMFILGSSCAKDNMEKDSAVPEILTNVFQVTETELSDKYSLRTSVEPYYDAVTGELLICCTDGENNTVLTIGSDRTVVKEQPLDGYLQPRNGVLRENNLYSVCTMYDDNYHEQTYHIVTYSLADGTYTVSEDVRAMFSQNGDGFLLKRIAVDGDGNFCLASEWKIVVTDSIYIYGRSGQD